MATQQDIRTLVDRFVTDLSVMVHQDALDAVRAALGQSPAPKRPGPGRPREVAKRGPGRPRKAGAKRGPGRPKKAAPRRAKARGRVRRSAADLDQTAAEILAYVRANPGQGVEEIGRGLKTATEGLKRPIQALIAAGKLRTEGQKRGTKYFAGGRGGPKRKAAKKAGRKTKRKATRKVAKKSKAKRTAKKARRKLSPEQKAVLVERLAKARAARRAAG